jgi:hypothetical protein
VPKTSSLHLKADHSPFPCLNTNSRMACTRQGWPISDVSICVTYVGPCSCLGKLPSSCTSQIMTTQTLPDPIAVAARSKASTAFASSNAQGIDVCLFSVCVVLCIGNGLGTGLSSAQGVLPTIYIYINLRGLSPRANYTDRAIAACRLG